MSALKADYVTKYDAGGTGDNIIPDGYIKTVEKVWMDTYSFTAVLTTADTLTIARIPANKKIASVEVYFPALTPTTTTINVGITGSQSLLISSSPVVIDTLGICYARTNTINVPYLTTATTTVLFSLGVAAITAPTAGTIRTIVRYT